MEKEETLSMALKTWKRLGIIQETLKKRLKQREAAALLGLSLRQVQRIVRRVALEGERGILHKLKGRISNRRYPDSFRAKVLRLYETRYRGFGPGLAQEKLREREKIRIGRETLRLWLLEKKLWEPRKKPRRHRQWRERKACLGEMVQMDGSHHDWLEGRGPKLVLMGYIDDATNTIFARFYDYEGTFPAMESFLHYTRRYGLPQSVYVDRHTTYRSPRKAGVQEELLGQRKSQSQFERALTELEVRMIPAFSPQAKGRVERLFGTLQDRLVKEMRLAKVQTKEEANHFLTSYLPRFNRRFQREPRSPVNLHRPVPPGVNLKQILSVQTRHLLRKDSTIRWEGKLYLIQGYRSRNGSMWIQAEERLDGKLRFFDGERTLRFRLVKEAPKISQASPASFRIPRRRGRNTPPPHHPWRQLENESRHRQIRKLLKNLPKPPEEETLISSAQHTTFLTGQEYDISNWR